MVNNLTDRDLWRRQGEAYLRKVGSRPPVHPLLAAAQARRAAEGREHEEKRAA